MRKKRKIAYRHAACGGELRAFRDGDYKCKACKALVYVGENPTAHVASSINTPRPEPTAPLL